jgi:hypothetical protein
VVIDSTLRELPFEIHIVLGDRHDKRDELQALSPCMDGFC